MSRSVQQKSFDRRWEIREKKAHDYATDVDVLSNFKRTSEICNLFGIDIKTPYGIAMLYAILKIDRLSNLVFRNKVAPTNESLLDTIDDLKNYIDLMEECMVDTGVIIN
jgi:hypothetical protein